MNEPEKLNPIHPGEVLLEECLKPMGLSQNQLALSIRVPARRINEIVHGKHRVTADTALRLARTFSMSPQFWLGLQMDYDLDVAKDEIGERLDREVAVGVRRDPLIGFAVAEVAAPGIHPDFGHGADRAIARAVIGGEDERSGQRLACHAELPEAGNRRQLVRPRPPTCLSLRFRAPFHRVYCGRATFGYGAWWLRSRRRHC